MLFHCDEGHLLRGAARAPELRRHGGHHPYHYCYYH